MASKEKLRKILSIIAVFTVVVASPITIVMALALVEDYIGEMWTRIAAFAGFMLCIGLVYTIVHFIAKFPKEENLHVRRVVTLSVVGLACSFASIGTEAGTGLWGKLFSIATIIFLLASEVYYVYCRKGGKIQGEKTKLHPMAYTMHVFNFMFILFAIGNLI